MLKISKNPEWTHVVTVSVPVDEGFENQTCRVRYRLMDKVALEETAQNDPEAILRATVVKVDDLVDMEGKALLWNDQVADMVFAMPFVQAALIKGYFRSVTGAREGNFSGPGALGSKVA